MQIFIILWTTSLCKSSWYLPFATLRTRVSRWEEWRFTSSLVLSLSFLLIKLFGFIGGFAEILNEFVMCIMKSERLTQWAFSTTFFRKQNSSNNSSSNAIISVTDSISSWINLRCFILLIIGLKYKKSSLNNIWEILSSSTEYCDCMISLVISLFGIVNATLNASILSKICQSRLAINIRITSCGIASSSNGLISKDIQISKTRNNKGYLGSIFYKLWEFEYPLQIHCSFSIHIWFLWYFELTPELSFSLNEAFHWFLLELYHLKLKNICTYLNQSSDTDLKMSESDSSKDSSTSRPPISLLSLNQNWYFTVSIFDVSRKITTFEKIWQTILFFSLGAISVCSCLLSFTL